MVLQLSDNINKLPKLGQKSAERLAHFNINNIADFLLHLPHRYQNKTIISKLTNLTIGAELLFRLTVQNIEKSYGKTQQIIYHLTDNDNNKLIVRFFNYSKYMHCSRGDIVECFGEVKITKLGLELYHPEFSNISQNGTTLLATTFTPVYYLTKGIYQQQIRKWIKDSLDIFNNNNIFEINFNKTTFKQAINTLHYPSATDNIADIINFNHPAQQYLIIEEFISKKLIMLRAREKIRQQKTIACPLISDLNMRIILDFSLTNAQQKAINEINSDLAKNTPMLRLLQGDVGSGKTIVAIFSTLHVVENNAQVAIMVPTTILSEQHFITFSKYLAPLGIKIAFLHAKQNKAERLKQLHSIQTDAKVIIGTHNLFQDEVKFNNLLFIIIDEQHKFGVEQRLLLSGKSKHHPHQLVMTATPIPRSIIMSVYGEMDISIINELPKNRKTIHTIAVSNNKKNQLLEKIRQVYNNGNKIYWVCTLIEDSENFDAISAEKTYNFLQTNLKELNIALIHSRIKDKQKRQIMQDFSNGKVDLLVATTVVEVGVDIPLATLIVIENAERLGLSQLHQLRGRVGRSDKQSMCILMYQPPLGVNAKKRLDIIRKTNNGFIIANKDLEIRGAGEILGTNQTGLATMKIADIVRDTALLTQSNKLTLEIKGNINKEQQNILFSRWGLIQKEKYINS